MYEISYENEVFLKLSGLTDSKKLTHDKREALYSSIENLFELGKSFYTFAYRDAQRIDEIWIRNANRECMQDIILSFLSYIESSDSIDIYIDGCDNYIFEGDDFWYIFAQKRNKKKSTEIQVPLTQKRTIQFIINGDILIPAISASSIVAKVLRDRMMSEFHEDFPAYGFALHKGYGTRKHQDALINYGITPIHRKSYAPIKRLIFANPSV